MLIRIFIGSPVTDPLGVLHRQCVSVQQNNPGWRIVHPANWHITYAFPGNIDPLDLPDIVHKTSLLAKAHAPLHLQADQLMFMPVDQPQMLWMRMQPHEGFDELFYAFHRELGLKAQHPPTPHVTLMRGAYKQLIDRRLKPEKLDTVHQHLRCVNIYQSFLQAGGSRYAIIESFPMKRRQTSTPR